MAVQTVHQHTAPMVDGDAQLLLAALADAPAQLEPEWIEAAAGRLAGALRRALDKAEPFDQVGFGQAKVERVGASRRVRAADGRILVRWSACKDPALRAMPEGDFDPMLKTITLARGGRPLVRLHYYAVHPQSYYRDGRASWDFPGMAREAVEAKEGVAQIYFTGCGGDVTAGKYNDGTPAARARLAAHLQAGMESAIAATRYTGVERIGWRTAMLTLPPRNDAGFTMEDSLANMKNAKRPYNVRTYRGAMRAAFLRRADQPFELGCLELGPVRAIHLPGEPMVAFQFYAQRLRRDLFVAVAGYGDGSPGYLCTAAAMREGGYEPTDSMVAPEGETAVKAAIDRLLGLR